MEEKKLTDEEIIKAIDKCFAIPMKCKGDCPEMKEWRKAHRSAKKRNNF